MSREGVIRTDDRLAGCTFILSAGYSLAIPGLWHVQPAYYFAFVAIERQMGGMKVKNVYNV